MDNIRQGAPYNDPSFELLCRDHAIWGTVQAALCAVFWEAGQRARPGKKITVKLEGLGGCVLDIDENGVAVMPDVTLRDIVWKAVARDAPDLGLDDVIEWADGIRGDLGTEHAHKVTDKEASIASAIEAANKGQRYPGEEIMVNAPHGVYTLPLQDSGLSTGPRFVVHVPGPEPVDAGDEATRLFQGLGDELNVLACKMWGMAEQYRAGQPAAPHDALSQVCQRYIDILKRNWPSLDGKKIEKMPPGRETTPVHMRWMLEQIPALPPLKAHRWLGFVQGVLVTSGRTTVEAEREATRSLLGGDVQQAEIQRLRDRIAELDAQLGSVIDQRDAYETMADRLARGIATHLGVDLGEHSSGNCPWHNALDALESGPAQVTGNERCTKDGGKCADGGQCDACTPAQLAARVKALEAALWKIERWEEFPPTGKNWEKSGEPISYRAAFGSNGERDYMRGVAREALRGLAQMPSKAIIMTFADSPRDGLPADLRDRLAAASCTVPVLSKTLERVKSGEFDPVYVCEKLAEYAAQLELYIKDGSAPQPDGEGER